jgi:hypothetical protein
MSEAAKQTSISPEEALMRAADKAFPQFEQSEDRARGWSGLNGAVDTSFKVSKPKGVPEITFTMDKDNDPLGGEILPPVVCAIESHPMGKDPWGNDVVAPYLPRAERVDVDFHKMEVKQETKDSVLFMIGDLEETHKRYVNLEGRKNHAPDVFAEFFPDKVADLSPKDIHNLKKEWTAAIVILKDEGRLREVTTGSSGKKRTWLAIVPGARPPASRWGRGHGMARRARRPRPPKWANRPLQSMVVASPRSSWPPPLASWSTTAGPGSCQPCDFCDAAAGMRQGMRRREAPPPARSAAPGRKRSNDRHRRPRPSPPGPRFDHRLAQTRSHQHGGRRMRQPYQAAPPSRLQRLAQTFLEKQDPLGVMPSARSAPDRRDRR